MEQNLDNATTQTIDYDITQEQIEASASILANILLDYVKQYGDVSTLSPEGVFGKGEPH